MKHRKSFPLQESASYISGRMGAGLFLLRVITALALSRSGYSLQYDTAAIHGSALGWSLPRVMSTLLPILGLAMVTGFATAFVGIVACASLVVSFGWLDLAANELAATAAGLSIVLALLGPGAYSLDAYFFGWRRIEIPTSVRKP